MGMEVSLARTATLMMHAANPQSHLLDCEACGCFSASWCSQHAAEICTLLPFLFPRP